MAGRLTAINLKTLVNPGRYTDGDGLHLLVKGPEKRSWVYRYMLHGKSRDMGLGPFPEVSLAEARDRAAEARQLVRQGVDPLAERQYRIQAAKAARVHTFRQAAEDHIAAKSPGWRNEKHRAQWSSTLEKYAYPVFGDWPVQNIDTEAVLRVLGPLWQRIPETASRLRGRIEVILDDAKVREWRQGENPARWRGHLALRLPPARKVKPTENYPSLPWQQIKEFARALRAREGSAARAIEFAILTAARSGEVRGMCWAEVDWANAIWFVPAVRMKAKRPHRVPLSQQALDLLSGIKPDAVKPEVYVFPGADGRPLSDMSLTAVIRRMNEVADGQPIPWRDPVQDRAIVVHGFRSTFRVWAGENTSFPREVVEAALAHTIKDKAEAAYARTDLLERRRPLMQEWADFCLAVDVAEDGKRAA
jgi:integrase